MKILKKYIVHGWPEKKKDVEEKVRMYFTYKEELTIDGEFLYKGDQLVIPPKMRRRILDIVHSAHLGIQSCLRLARKSVFWPGMTRDISNVVETCSAC